MPVLQRATERYAEQGLVILAVNAGESANMVQAYMEALGLTFPALLDPDGSIIELYGIQAFPTTVWIDAQGIIQAKHLGPLSSDLIDGYMADLLDTLTPSP
jgi:peroxiredoxin